MKKFARNQKSLLLACLERTVILPADSDEWL
jgi:hypothetical protein